ncbi:MULTISPECIES: antibiotic biosynthesis monooxygenase family protein [Dyella]|nr:MULTISPECIES: antibiotic biosynthesis monooxygenase [Dyella]
MSRVHPDPRALAAAKYVVAFEVKPAAGETETYFDIAGKLRPALLAMDGFLANDRFRSRARPGAFLSLSFWESEAALVRWRNESMHRGAQSIGRAHLFEDYRLRVGRLVEPGAASVPGDGRAFVILDGTARDLPRFEQMADADVFDHLTEAGRVATVLECANAGAAWGLWTLLRPRQEFTCHLILTLRDYGLNRRQEAPIC